MAKVIQNISTLIGASALFFHAKIHLYYEVGRSYEAGGNLITTSNKVSMKKMYFKTQVVDLSNI